MGRAQYTLTRSFIAVLIPTPSLHSKIKRSWIVFVLGSALAVSGCNHNSHDNVAPSITVQSPQIVVQGETLAFNVVGKDPDPGTTLVYFVASAPPGFSSSPARNGPEQ